MRQANVNERDDVMVAHFLIKGLGEDEGGHKHVEIKWLLLIKQHSVSSLLQGPRSHPVSLTEHRCQWAV